jgi:hypothetical protein
MVILSTVMAYSLLSGLFTGTASGSGLDAAAFMRGFHEVFLFGTVTAVIAAICSSLRGSDHLSGTPVARKKLAVSTGAPRPSASR